MEPPLKRTLDLLLATLLLVLSAPVLAGIAVLVRFIDGPPVLHRALRVGRAESRFTMYKFRTMVREADQLGPAVTLADDPRVTRLGKLLRLAKLDELPQLVNVLKGDMSFVGPRPEDPHFLVHYTAEQRVLLQARPGITSLASIAFRDEQRYMAGAGEQEYIEHILPRKLALDLEYLAGRSLWSDLVIMLRTVLAVLPLASPLAAPRRFVRRHIPWMVIDAAIIAVAFCTAVELRFVDETAGEVPAMWTLLLALTPLIALYLLVNEGCGLNRRMWGLASAREIGVIFSACAASTIIALAVDLLVGHFMSRRVLPISVVVLGGLLTFSGMTVVRYRSRLPRIAWRPQLPEGTQQIRTLIYGAGDAGQFIAWWLLSQPRGATYKLVGFLDDDRSKLGLRVHGLPVLGDRGALEAVVKRQAIELVILAFSTISGEDMREIVSSCQRTEAQIKIVPGVFALMTGAPGPLLREVKVEDLLGRRELIVDRHSCLALLQGRVVLVTGASGSVGSELCRQIATFSPTKLVALDSNESGLFDEAIDLRTRFPGLDVEIVVADVTVPSRIDQVFAWCRPDIVFHAAAYKHVPLMETFPEEAVRVNIVGTKTVLDAARRHRASRFVLVSTDKAVSPASAMGASKRIAELLVMAAGQERPAHDGRDGTRLTAVRFGNVLGSRGSVVPTFARQIELGGPVTVTHPEMTRYFMEISEAASLILQAAALTQGRDIFMLDMGERIRIDDLARKMIRMRGLRPGVDIPIVYTGMRPGEKLHEDLLFAAERVEQTEHPLIFRVRSRPAHPEAALRREVEQLLIDLPDGEARSQSQQIIDFCRSTVPSGDRRHARRNTEGSQRHKLDAESRGRRAG